MEEKLTRNKKATTFQPKISESYISFQNTNQIFKTQAGNNIGLLSFWKITSTLNEGNQNRSYVPYFLLQEHQ